MKKIFLRILLQIDREKISEFHKSCEPIPDPIGKNRIETRNRHRIQNRIRTQKQPAPDPDRDIKKRYCYVFFCVFDQFLSHAQKFPMIRFWDRITGTGSGTIKTVSKYRQTGSDTKG